MGTVLFMVDVTLGPALSNASWISCASFAVDIVDKHSQATSHRLYNSRIGNYRGCPRRNAFPSRAAEREVDMGAPAGAGRCPVACPARRNLSHGTMAASRISAPFSFLIWERRA